MSQPSSDADHSTFEAVAAAQVRQTEILETTARLAGGIGHDLNNVLSTIFGYTEFLDSQLRKRGDCHAELRDLSEIQMAAERAQQFAQRLLSFAQRLPTRPGLVAPQEIVRGLEPVLRRLVSPRTEFKVLLTSDSGHIAVDRTQLERALTNLTLNAVDAMPAGGALTISAEWRDLDTTGMPAGVVFGRVDRMSGVWLDYSVSDTGRGMTNEYIQQAFMPYVTTRTSEEIGKGLGLSAVYGLVGKANGLVVVDSTLRAGTTVHILIPRAPESETKNFPG